MIKIGLTGNRASGKSEVTNIIKNLGFPTICADSICHELLLNDKKTIDVSDTLKQWLSSWE